MRFFYAVLQEHVCELSWARLQSRWTTMVQNFPNLWPGIVKTSVSISWLLLINISVMSFQLTGCCCCHREWWACSVLWKLRHGEQERCQTWTNQSSHCNRAYLDNWELQFFTRLRLDCQREQESVLFPLHVLIIRLSFRNAMLTGMIIRPFY